MNYIAEAKTIIDSVINDIVNFVGFNISSDEIKLSVLTTDRDELGEKRESFGRYNPKTKEVYIFAEFAYNFVNGHKNNFISLLIETVAHEIRHYWQHKTGFMQKHIDHDKKVSYNDRIIEIDAHEFAEWYVNKCGLNKVAV